MEEKILSELTEIRRMTILGQKKALTLSDASILTGLSKSNLYKQTCRKSIPHYKSAKMVYFDRDELTDWMLQNRVKTTDELETEAATYVVIGKGKGVKNV